MYRLRRNDADYSVISDVARLTRSDVMFASHLGVAHTSLDEVKHHYEVTSLAKQTSLKNPSTEVDGFFLVRETGLEPVQCELHAPQTCASASSATLAFAFLHATLLLYNILPVLSIYFSKKYLIFIKSSLCADKVMPL